MGVYDFISLFYCLTVLWCVCVVPGPVCYISYSCGTIHTYWKCR